jgi:hypothetical protein
MHKRSVEELARLRNMKRERKLKLLEILGGCCIDCGYDANPAALDFDHDLESPKGFNIGINLGLSWPRLVEELQKCVIRCANCHRINAVKNRPAAIGRDRRFLRKL